MASRRDPYPDLIQKDRIQQWLYERTGTRVSKCRIGRWITTGEIPLIQRPRRYGGGQYTRGVYLDALIARYSR